ncbi:hypothetical protein GHT06_020896 [Daphnia sinensis]|uniref:Uncharacterized protein n=1 Tax=Daphnia sinensis TaxID=1820382 RepID=A0AAD5KIG7_9CRUS|nr:hypothetical protein GHT06_020896 [Daphnia sinensis]
MEHRSSPIEAIRLQTTTDAVKEQRCTNYGEPTANNGQITVQYALEAIEPLKPFIVFHLWSPSSSSFWSPQNQK